MLPEKPKCGVGVLVGLEDGEEQPEADRQPQAPLHLLAGRSRATSAWCAQVAAQPEQSRISVLISGRCQGSKVSMPAGGQVPGMTVDALDRRPSGRARA